MLIQEMRYFFSRLFGLYHITIKRPCTLIFFQPDLSLFQDNGTPQLPDGLCLTDDDGNDVPCTNSTTGGCATSIKDELMIDGGTDLSHHFRHLSVVGPSRANQIWAVGAERRLSTTPGSDTGVGSNCSSGLLSCLGESRCSADASSSSNCLGILGNGSSTGVYSNGAGGDAHSLTGGSSGGEATPIAGHLASSLNVSPNSIVGTRCLDINRCSPIPPTMAALDLLSIWEPRGPNGVQPSMHRTWMSDAIDNVTDTGLNASACNCSAAGDDQAHESIIDRASVLNSTAPSASEGLPWNWDGACELPVSIFPHTGNAFFYSMCLCKISDKNHEKLVFSVLVRIIMFAASSPFVACNTKNPTVCLICSGPRLGVTCFIHAKTWSQLVFQQRPIKRPPMEWPTL